MATGTGKTYVAFQICWKLWSAALEPRRASERRKPRILYLADRNILVDDPKDKTFAPFGDARWKIEDGVAVKSREMYFAIYQAHRPGRARGPASTASTRPTSSTSSSSTSATAAARRTRATGARSSSTSRPPTSSA